MDITTYGKGWLSRYRFCSFHHNNIVVTQRSTLPERKQLRLSSQSASLVIPSNKYSVLIQYELVMCGPCYDQPNMKSLLPHPPKVTLLFHTRHPQRQPWIKQPLLYEETIAPLAGAHMEIMAILTHHTPEAAPAQRWPRPEHGYLI